MSRTVLHHRTKEFITILERVRENLKFLFETKQPVYVLSSSGTGAMEASIVNLFNEGDEVIVINAGKFGERWEKIAKAHRLNPVSLKLDWGEAVDPDAYRKFLSGHTKARGVLFQASETSTGVAHPVKELAQITHEESDALVIVDAITALGVAPLPMDEWGLDAVITGSQKALMLPPGLAFLALSPRANQRREESRLPHFYFSLKQEDKAALGGETAWTPAVSLVCGLDLVLQKMKAAGLPAIYEHHARLATATRKATEAMGLELLPRTSPSNALTAVKVPSTISDGKKIVSHFRDRFGVTVAGGQDHWKGKMFRLAHLGYFDELDMLTVLSATELTLKTLGHPFTLGAGVGAASSYFLENKR